jgi:membrane protease YdiL (CAAX protease family)
VTSVQVDMLRTVDTTRADDVEVTRDISPWVVIGLLSVSVGVVILFSVALDRLDLHGPALPLNIGVKLLTATVALATVDRLGWWRRAGFRTPSRWSRLWLGWLPLIYLLLVYAPGFPASGVLRTFGIAVLAFAVGLDEETWTRGLLLESLRHRGTFQAVLLSAVFFGLIHSINIVGGQPVSTTAVQVFVALSFGLALGALRVRTHSIWPCIFVHAAWDFALILRSGEIGESDGTALSQALVTMAIMTPLAIYGLVLIRPGRTPGRDGRMRRSPQPMAGAPPVGVAVPYVLVEPAPTADALGPWPAPPPEVEAIYRGS